MSHPAVASSEPLVFAHRGGAALAPENTLSAFDLGLSLGADGLELDVRLSRDGVAVVHHDALLDRTTDARGPLAAKTAEELARVDAGSKFARDNTNPFRGQRIGIPMLKTVLDRYKQTRLIIELKENSASLVEAVVRDVRQANAIERVCLGCFARFPLRLVRRLEPAIATSAAREEVRWALYRSWVSCPVRRPPYVAFQVPERHEWTTVVSPRFIRAAHATGIVVQVWTINDPHDMTRLLAWEADGLITDRPDLAVDLVRQSRTRNQRTGLPR